MIPSLETTGRKYIKPNILGDVSEYIVVTEALKRGAEVFKNSCCTGKSDMILKYNNQLYEIDVKTERNQDGYWKSTGPSYREGIYFVFVNPITWKVRWITGKAPTPIENFWNDHTDNTID